MEKTKLQTILESNARTAYERLLEIQSQGIKLDLMQFSEWKEKWGKTNQSRLMPELTTFFKDGWERFTAREHSMLELYVDNHSTIYSYDLIRGNFDQLYDLYNSSY